MRGDAHRTLWLAVALAYGASACTTVGTMAVTRMKPDA